MNAKNIATTLDHVTDLAAVGAIGYIAIYGDPTTATLGALVSIALGKKVLALGKPA